MQLAAKLVMHKFILNNQEEKKKSEYIEQG
jgi:hypothetical protein